MLFCPTNTGSNPESATTYDTPSREPRNRVNHTPNKSFQPSCFPKSLGFNLKELLRSTPNFQEKKNRLYALCPILHICDFYFSSLICCVNIYTLIIFSSYLFKAGLAVTSFLCQTQKTLQRTHFNKDDNILGSLQASESSRPKSMPTTITLGLCNLSESSVGASIFFKDKFFLK